MFSTWFWERGGISWGGNSQGRGETQNEILTNLREKLILDIKNDLNNQKRNKIKP